MNRNKNLALIVGMLALVFGANSAFAAGVSVGVDVKVNIVGVTAIQWTADTPVVGASNTTYIWTVTPIDFGGTATPEVALKIENVGNRRVDLTAVLTQVDGAAAANAWAIDRTNATSPKAGTDKFSLGIKNLANADYFYFGADALEQTTVLKGSYRKTSTVNPAIQLDLRYHAPLDTDNNASLGIDHISKIVITATAG